MVETEKPVKKPYFFAVKKNLGFDIGELPDLESMKYKVQSK